MHNWSTEILCFIPSTMLNNSISNIIDVILPLKTQLFLSKSEIFVPELGKTNPRDGLTFTKKSDRFVIPREFEFFCYCRL